MDRRRLLTRIAAGAVATAAGGWLLIRPWLPWISRGPDGRWHLGPASRFPEGHAVLLRRARAIVVRDELGLRAISAICTHEACTVHDLPARKELVCPCHGGAYDYLGRVKRGPPPADLPWLALTEEGGELVLDPNQRVKPF
jgi:nitrite reductase/ring-hydroxylating ferredoxin subunit